MEVDELEIRKVAKECIEKGAKNMPEKEKKDFEDRMVAVMLKEESLGQALGLDEIDLEALYCNAFFMYNAGKFKEARDMFLALKTLNPGDTRFWYGLGATNQKLKNYRQAIIYYMTNGYMDLEDPMPFYFSSDCYLQLGEKPGAIVMLDVTIQRCGEKKEYSQVKEKAMAEYNKLKGEK